MAQLGAVRVLEQLGDAEEERGRAPRQHQPGLVIVIAGQAAPPLPGHVVDVSPLPSEQ
jgi:hypothetical protein